MEINPIKYIAPLFIFLTVINAQAQERTDPADQGEELGKVGWLRDFDAAISLSKKHDKPVLILFQEVPGCSTCRNYGNNVLSHPLMVEAIENEFIPLAIFNNKGGKDKQILEKYDEPTWNNPVVRIVDDKGTNLSKRISGDYTSTGLYDAMVTVLKSEYKPIPEYIKLLGEELAAATGNATEDKYFKMYCFWTGEKQLGSNEGVLNTEAGFMKGHEVVKVTYDKDRISEKSLDRFAQNNSMSPIAKDSSYRPAKSDEDYYLQHTAYKYLPLTPLQRTKINSTLGNRKSAEKYLSPKQLKWLNEASSLKGKTALYNKPFVEAWGEVAGI